MMENSKLKLRFPRALFSTFNSCKTRNLISDVIIQQQESLNPATVAAVAESYYSPNSEPPLIPFSSNSIDPLLPSPVRRSRRRRYSYPSRSSSCKPRCPETLMVRENCILSVERRRKVFPSGEKRNPPWSSLFSSPNDTVCGGRRCPPASPASPFAARRRCYSKLKKVEITEKQRCHGMRDGAEGRMRRTRRRIRAPHSSMRKKEKEEVETSSFHCSVNVSSSYDEHQFSSSDNDDEREELEGDDEDDSDSQTGTFFSSSTSTHSSDSGSTRIHNNLVLTNKNKRESVHLHRRRRRDQGRVRNYRSELAKPELQVSLEDEKIMVKDSGAFAVMKSSSDPYSDFRDSMLEMIVERQMFRAKELQRMLECFLSLNSSHHHRVIVEVFSEILDALFST